jgi:1,4-alpha-glucan branching enzyme
MNAISGKPSNDRYSARNMVKPVNFYCSAPTAQSVFLVGDFNEWNSLANPMRRQADGWWFAQVQLTHGYHRYCFLVDGDPTLDRCGSGITRNERNWRVSLIAVS